LGRCVKEGKDLQISQTEHRNISSVENETFYLNVMAATRLINVGTGPCFPLCSIPSSFNNICKHLELRRPAAGPLGEEVFFVECKCFQVVKGQDCRQVSPAPGLFCYEAMLLE